jgi:hypothetical protein
MPWLFTRPRVVTQITTKNGDTFDVEPGSYWTMASPTGEDFVTWTTAGERFATPAHRIRRVVRDDDGEHGDMGFA